MNNKFLIGIICAVSLLSCCKGIQEQKEEIDLTDCIGEDESLIRDLNARYLDAARDGNLQEVIRALEAGAERDAEYDEGNALQLAAENGHLPVVQYLVGRGIVNIHADNDLALQLAVANSQWPVADYLLQRGSPITAISTLSDLRSFVRNSELARQIMIRAAQQQASDPLRKIGRYKKDK